LMSKVFEQLEARSGVAYHFHPTAIIANYQHSTKIKISTEMLKAVFTGLLNSTEKDELLKEIAIQINENAENYKLDTPLRLSHFFAQIRQEIGAKCSTQEDFTYSETGL